MTVPKTSNSGALTTCGTEPRKEVPGLDVLRAVALVAVVIQHGFSVLDRSNYVDWGPISLGQFGVSLFLAISGYLAAKSDLAPGLWLLRRLSRIYPAYWITMLLSFGLTYVSGYKSFDMSQFASQMIGVGFFTHSENLVNVVTWFISLLLLCYGIAFVARVLRAEVLVFSVVILVALWQGRLERAFMLVPVHVISFAVAYLIARRGGPTWVFCVVASALGIVAIHNIYLLYPMISLGLFGTTNFFFRSKLLTTAMKYSYEFYLVHGMCFAGVVHLMGRQYPFLAILCAISISCTSAMILSLMVHRLAATTVSEWRKRPPT